MTLRQAYDLIDLLLDKADQPYFTDDEKNQFLDQSIMSYINHHYRFYEQEQVSRDALQFFQFNTTTNNVAEFVDLHENYVHIIFAQVNNNQIKILGSKDYFDNRNLNSNDPFNRATLNDPIGYVLQDQFFYDPNSGVLGASDTVDTIELIFRNRDEVFDQEEADVDGVIATGVKELYQREIIDIAVRKMTGNIESANIQYQQIEAEQSKSI